MLRLELVIELFRDALDIEGIAQALCHLDHGHVAGGIELADFENEGAEFGKEEVAGLVDFEVMVAIVLPVSRFTQYQRLWFLSALRKMRRFSW